MELEFEAVHEQLDCEMYINVDGGLDLWYFYTYPEILWDHLYNNTSDGRLDLRSFSLDDDASRKVSAHKETLQLSHVSKPQSEAKQSEVEKSQNLKGNRSLTNSRVSQQLNTKCFALLYREKSKPKPKVCWTPELHRLFVKAVEEVGLHNAVPTKILSLMGVSCLTRHHIASHLQKYRLAIKRGKPKKEACCRRRKTTRSHILQNCPEIQNQGDQCLENTSDKTIRTARAIGTANYEKALQTMPGYRARLFYNLSGDENSEAVCLIDLQARINSTAACRLGFM